MKRWQIVFPILLNFCAEPAQKAIAPSAGKPRAPLSIESRSETRGQGLVIFVDATVAEDIDSATFELRGSGERIHKAHLKGGEKAELVFTLPRTPQENPVLDARLDVGTMRYKSSHEILIVPRETEANDAKRPGVRSNMQSDTLKEGQRAIKEL